MYNQIPIGLRLRISVHSTDSHSNRAAVSPGRPELNLAEHGDCPETFHFTLLAEVIPREVRTVKQMLGRLVPEIGPLTVTALKLGRTSKFYFARDDLKEVFGAVLKPERPGSSTAGPEKLRDHDLAIQAFAPL